MNSILNRLGMMLARHLALPRPDPNTSISTDVARLRACLQPADVILVEGHSRFSSGIKYLTQSTWSHAALYVGDALNDRTSDPKADGKPCVVEADVIEGVRAVGLEAFSGMHVRVCRAVSLTSEERQAVVTFAIARLGHRYDLKNIVDLVRWLLPNPPVPERFRRRMIQLGSGDPTQAICSTLLAQAFQSVHYPILPMVEQRPANDPTHPNRTLEVLHARHHSHFVPKDFDVSPYFQVIKPTLASGFDHHALKWSSKD